jgi:ABC-type Mn2+/Zn2+ transport system ATPase subunit
MSPTTVLEIALRKQLGETMIDVAFSSDGRVTALFGPSGSGKTSIVNMIAGLIQPERGRIQQPRSGHAANGSFAPGAAGRMGNTPHRASTARAIVRNASRYVICVSVKRRDLRKASNITALRARKRFPIARAR